ncbi:Hypothetical predicted protein [Olea europaea subsp. europaea]|uniref:Uncharacterized protein n=1 Tax=Olea europaea subsp. europaea TaxID=158383 RepID=A0A8S0RH04_OLEEU|nr:Hypothetical predicted protein [Olea europaea subsp. europaea]
MCHIQCSFEPLLALFVHSISVPDEDGELLMDFDKDIQSDHDEHRQDFLEDGNDDGWNNNNKRERFPTPMYNDSKTKPKKQLIKSSSPTSKASKDDEGGVDRNLGIEEDDVEEIVRDDCSDGSGGGKRKREKGEKRMRKKNLSRGRVEGH